MSLSPSSPHTHARGVIRRLLLLPLAFVTLPLSASPWEDVSVGLFNDARAAFSGQADDAPESERRNLVFGEAVALLNVQPRTAANIEKAYGLFEKIREANPTDELGLNSRYLQGRIEQIHRPTPDVAKAEAIFAELVQAHPAHPVAQRARVKLAIIRLYANIEAAERRRRYDDMTSHARDLADPGAKVQMHLLLGAVARRFGFGYEQELAHMLAADQAGVVKRSIQISLLARIGDLARLTGKTDVARTYYTRFLEEFPRTDSRSTIEGYLADLN